MTKKKYEQSKTKDRFKHFSVVLNVRGGESINWQELDTEEYANKMTELDFITPLELAQRIGEFSGIYQNNSKDPAKARKFKFEGFKGQLEKGSTNARPHYNLVVTTSASMPSSTLARELTRMLFDIPGIDGSVNVAPAYSLSDLTDYCLKEETRLELRNTSYYPPRVDINISTFDKIIKEDEELKKYIFHLAGFKNF